MLKMNTHKHLDGSQGKMSLAVNFEVKKGEFIALMGESGSGKTTLLRILTGLEKAEGNIEVEGQFWLKDGVQIPPQKRGIGFVFQDAALFENMSVEENLLFVNSDKALAKKLLALTELTQLSTHNVKQLSGGQKQRVNLCRAMMNQPKLLLMDEPFSALDNMMKTKLQNEILNMHKTFGTTTIMVSHDAESSYVLADRVMVLEQGEIIKEGKKEVMLVKRETSTYAIVG